MSPRGIGRCTASAAVCCHGSTTMQYICYTTLPPCSHTDGQLTLQQTHSIGLMQQTDYLFAFLQPSWPFSALSGAAGGVLLAKTATGELAWGDVWFDDITTRNPWNVNTGSCGSSAGSAVAVAAGGCLLWMQQEALEKHYRLLLTRLP